MTTTILICLVIWVVLMILWLLGGGYSCYDPAKPYLIGTGVLIPWVCVLILGLVAFGAFSSSNSIR